MLLGCARFGTSPNRLEFVYVDVIDGAASSFEFEADVTIGRGELANDVAAASVDENLGDRPVNQELERAAAV